MARHREIDVSAVARMVGGKAYKEPRAVDVSRFENPALKCVGSPSSSKPCCDDCAKAGLPAPHQVIGVGHSKEHPSVSSGVSRLHQARVPASQGGAARVLPEAISTTRFRRPRRIKPADILSVRDRALADATRAPGVAQWPRTARLYGVALEPSNKLAVLFPSYLPEGTALRVAFVDVDSASPTFGEVSSRTVAGTARQAAGFNGTRAHVAGRTDGVFVWRDGGSIRMSSLRGDTLRATPTLTIASSMRRPVTDVRGRVVGVEHWDVTGQAPAVCEGRVGSAYKVLVAHAEVRSGFSHYPSEAGVALGILEYDGAAWSYRRTDFVACGDSDYLSNVSIAFDPDRGEWLVAWYCGDGLASAVIRVGFRLEKSLMATAAHPNRYTDAAGTHADIFVSYHRGLGRFLIQGDHDLHWLESVDRLDLGRGIVPTVLCVTPDGHATSDPRACFSLNQPDNGIAGGIWATAPSYSMGAEYRLVRPYGQVRCAVSSDCGPGQYCAAPPRSYCADSSGPPDRLGSSPFPVQPTQSFDALDWVPGSPVEWRREVPDVAAPRPFPDESVTAVHSIAHVVGEELAVAIMTRDEDRRTVISYTFLSDPGYEE